MSATVVENVVMENVVVEKGGKKVEKKEKAVKLQVKYERIYMSLFTVLNSFCIPSENEGDFVLKPEEMRKILDAVEFYNDDVGVQSAFIEENIFSKDNVKSSRKLMKAEKLQWKMDNGLIPEKKKRASRAKKVEDKPPKTPKKKSESIIETPIPDSMPDSMPDVKPVPVVDSMPDVKPVPVVDSMPDVKPVPVVDSMPDVKPVPVVENKKKVVQRKQPKKKTELAEDTPLP